MTAEPTPALGASDAVHAPASAGGPYDLAPPELIVPVGDMVLDREDVSAADLDTLQRAAEVAKRLGLSMALACTDPRCAADPLLSRVSEGMRFGYVLVCRHKLRVCLDRRSLRADRRRQVREHVGKGFAVPRGMRAPRRKR